MDPAPPPSIRHRLLQAFAVGLAVVFFYVVGIGPATYLSLRSPLARPYLERIYAPLLAVTERTALQPPLSRYILWWGMLALSHGAGQQHQSPPGDYLQQPADPVTP